MTRKTFDFKLELRSGIWILVWEDDFEEFSAKVEEVRNRFGRGII